MKKSLLALLFVLTMANFAHAAPSAWSGGWDGNLKVTDFEGQTYDCPDPRLVIHHNKQPKWEGIWLISGIPTCELGTHFPRSTQYEVKNGKIFYFDQEVGEITNDQIQLFKKSTAFKEYVTITKTLNGIKFSKRIVLAETLAEALIEGILQVN